MANHRIKPTVVPPENRDQASEYVSRIAANDAHIASVQAELDAELKLVKKRYDAVSMVFVTAREELLQGLAAWAASNRSDLTSGGKTKFADLTTGRIGWRDMPPKVSITKPEEVLKWLVEKRGKFVKFVRVKKEINRESMLEHKDLALQIEGVSIKGSGEEFYVNPLTSPLSEQPAKPE
jgi:phage host-nuclease inhibitor protein Gam